MQFTVDRKMWNRAPSETPHKISALLLNDGSRCCLGHLAKACGVPDKLMLNVAMPYTLLDLDATEHAKLPKELDVFTANVLANINDNSGIDDDERERRITEKFAEIG